MTIEQKTEIIVRVTLIEKLASELMQDIDELSGYTVISTLSNINDELFEVTEHTNNILARL